MTAEELRNVSGNDPNWPKAVRSLRAEGMEIRSRVFGDSDLPAGMFILKKNN